MCITISFAFICYSFSDTAFYILKIILCTPFLKIALGVGIFFLYIVHYFSVKRNKENFSPIISDSLPPILDSVSGALTYVSIMSTLITLFKGLFLQLVYNEEHFKDLGEIDVIFLALFLGILLWYCVNNIKKDLAEVLWVEHSRNINTTNQPQNSQITIKQ